MEEVIAWRRRAGAPFQGISIPGIAAGYLAVTTAPQNIANEDEHTQSQNNAAHCGEQVEATPACLWHIRINPARHALQPKLVHGEEGQIETNKHQPKVPRAR